MTTSDGQLDLFDVDEGRRRRDEGMALVSEHTGEWRDVALAVLVELADTHEPFTSEAVTARAGQPPSPNAVGALIAHACRARLIVRVGDAQAQRPNQHATRIGLWIGL